MSKKNCRLQDITITSQNAASRRFGLMFGRSADGSLGPPALAALARGLQAVGLRCVARGMPAKGRECVTRGMKAVGLRCVARGKPAGNESLGVCRA